MNIENPKKQQDIDRLTKTVDRFKPYSGVLSKNEILEYAPNSRAAAEIRLNLGENNVKDKMLVNWLKTWKISGILFTLVFLLIISISLRIESLALITATIALISVPVTIIYIIYLLFIKKYTFPDAPKPQKKVVPKQTPKRMTNPKLIQIEELKETYFSKEKIARELVEERFTPPQITYDKFISVIDSSTRLFTKEFETIEELANLDSNERINIEIDKKINILYSLIEKMEDLSNELILTKSQDNDEEVIEELEDLITSLKDYK